MARNRPIAYDRLIGGGRFFRPGPKYTYEVDFPMILADKIIMHRKKNGWSQEELAGQLNVSRQSVSKWEGAQSVPDLDRILKMAQLFGVSTDYLLKDELEEQDAAAAPADIPQSDAAVRAVSMEEANAFLKAKEQTTGRIALGTFLCTLAPVPLIVMAGISTLTEAHLSQGAGVLIGLTLLLAAVVIAVMLFFSCRRYTARFDYLATEVIETAYGVSGMVKQEKAKHEAVHTRLAVAGLLAGLLSPLPLLLTALLECSPMLNIAGLCLTILMGGLCAVLFILRGIPRESYDKLLEEGDYTRARKTSPVPVEAISTVFWLVTVAIYLGWSFSTNDWEISWIIWPVAGVLFAALSVILNSIASRSRRS